MEISQDSLMQGFAGDVHAHRGQSHFDTCTKTRLLFAEFHEFAIVFRRIPSLGRIRADHAGLIREFMSMDVNWRYDKGVRDR
jgi:hypothetical protein